MKKSSLSYKLLGVLFTALCLSFAGCEGNTDAIEYRNDEVSYAYGETCVERYLFYEDKGIYERYIAGQYWGETLPGMYFGTLYETGEYELSGDGDTKTVTFRPKKQYDFEKKYLVPLGLTGQVPFIGTLTDTTLTITWEVYNGEVPIKYTRK